MNYLKFGLIGLLLLGIGIAVGKYLTPPDIKTIVETKEVEVIKEIEKRVEVVKRDQQTHIIKTTRPDGTIVEETFIINKDTELVVADKQTEVDRKKETITEITQTSYKPQWSVGALYQLGNTYGAQVERRIVGPIFVGVYGLTNNSFGASLKVEF